ncbi:MAG: TetR/AcrR family transcriptional regulator [Bacteroidetes bacterium]|nr:TetR/AcrR family transcriptional regulator [Bacteroidota bacterium]
MRRRTGDKERWITAAAMKIFAREGFHGAKITSIAKEAGVATGSVYLYFANKEGLLQHIFSELWQAMHASFQDLLLRKELTEKERIEHLIDSIFDLFADRPALALLFVNEQPYLLREAPGEMMYHYVDFLRMGEQVVRSGIGKGEFSPDMHPRVFTNFVFGGIRQLLQQWARAPRQFPLYVIRTEIKRIVMQGLLPRAVLNPAGNVRA